MAGMFFGKVVLAVVIGGSCMVVGKIDGGDNHFCKLYDHGALLCWGQIGSENRLGVADRFTFLPLPPGRIIVDFDCADGQSTTWGVLDDGGYVTYEVNKYSAPKTASYLDGNRKILKISGTYGASFLVSPGEVYSGTTSVSGWVPLPTGKTATDVSCGWDYCCIVTNGGLLYCFGTNRYGVLGLGHTEDVITSSKWGDNFSSD
mmetsp:Transcript_171225/g.548977  ORF Transcript_171225/g.548977 Transcript_171225/m.548977 type:complete len:203 (+) Transcript_171225:118-726(+)